MAKFVDTLAMLCRKGFGDVRGRTERGAIMTVRALYEAEEAEPSEGDFHSQINAEGRLIVLRAALISAATAFEEIES